jgi:hypothetical protein
MMSRLLLSGRPGCVSGAGRRLGSLVAYVAEPTKVVGKRTGPAGLVPWAAGGAPVVPGPKSGQQTIKDWHVHNSNKFEP